jgi:hypothetical protein
MGFPAAIYHQNVVRDRSVLSDRRSCDLVARAQNQ